MNIVGTSSVSLTGSSGDYYFNLSASVTTDSTVNCLVYFAQIHTIPSSTSLLAQGSWQSFTVVNSTTYAHQYSDKQTNYANNILAKNVMRCGAISGIFPTPSVTLGITFHQFAGTGYRITLYLLSLSDADSYGSFGSFLSQEASSTQVVCTPFSRTDSGIFSFMTNYPGNCSDADGELVFSPASISGYGVTWQNAISYQAPGGSRSRTWNFTTSQTFGIITTEIRPIAPATTTIRFDQGQDGNHTTSGVTTVISTTFNNVLISSPHGKVTDIVVHAVPISYSSWIEGMKYGSQTMSLVDQKVVNCKDPFPGSQTQGQTESIWKLVNPSTGWQPLSMKLSAGSASQSAVNFNIFYYRNSAGMGSHTVSTTQQDNGISYPNSGTFAVNSSLSATNETTFVTSVGYSFQFLAASGNYNYQPDEYYATGYLPQQQFSGVPAASYIQPINGSGTDKKIKWHSSYIVGTASLTFLLRAWEMFPLSPAVLETELDQNIFAGKISFTSGSYTATYSHSITTSPTAVIVTSVHSSAVPLLNYISYGGTNLGFLGSFTETNDSMVHSAWGTTTPSSGVQNLIISSSNPSGTTYEYSISAVSFVGDVNNLSVSFTSSVSTDVNISTTSLTGTDSLYCHTTYGSEYYNAGVASATDYITGTFIGDGYQVSTWDEDVNRLNRYHTYFENNGKAGFSWYFIYVFNQEF